MIFLLWKAVALIYFHAQLQPREGIFSVALRHTPLELPGLLLDTVNVPQDTRVIHHNDERPDTLTFKSQLFQAVPLQFQVVI